MGARGLPVAEGGEAPAFGFVGKPPDQHAKEARSGGRSPLGRTFQVQLHEQGTGFEPRTPTGEMEGEIQVRPLIEPAGLGIVAPGGEVGPGVWKGRAEEGHC